MVDTVKNAGSHTASIFFMPVIGTVESQQFGTIFDAPTGKKLSLYQRTCIPIHTMSTTNCKPCKLEIFVSVNFHYINDHYFNWKI
jgi:hypothetical protein